MNQEQPDRQYYRAPANLMVRYGPFTNQGAQAVILDNEVWEMHSELEHAARELMDGDNLGESSASLMTVMKWLDFKLDLILFHLRYREMEAFLPHQTTTIDISGSGLGLLAVTEQQMGDRLVFALTMPDSPGRPIYAVGEVVRTEKALNEGGDILAVNFTQITEGDRERLIRYNFRQQRRELARRAEEARK